MSNETEIIVPKEMNEIKSQVMLVQQSANELIVENQDHLTQATDILHNVKQVKKFVTEKKEEITKPLMKSLANVRDLFKPLELGYAEAEKVIKAKMLAFQIEEDARIEKEKARLAARVEKGTMKAETAVNKLETIGEAPTKVTGEIGKSSIRTIKKVRIVDETLIPREYLVPNMTSITEAVLRVGAIIPGVEVYEEKSIVSR